MSDVAYPPINPGIVQPPYVAGRWYWADRYILGAANALATNTIRLNAIIVRRSITISDLFTRILTLSVGGNIQLALYAADPATQMPTGNAVAVTGSISTTTAQLVSADITGPDVALAPGLYWFASNSDNLTVVLQGANTGSAAVDSAIIGSATLSDLSFAASTASLVWTTPQTFGTWPSLTGATLTAVPGTNATAFGFKVSVGG